MEDFIGPLGNDILVVSQPDLDISTIHDTSPPQASVSAGEMIILESMDVSHLIKKSANKRPLQE